MLDILERCINEDRGKGGAGLRVCRIDGGHSDLERQHTIARFNANNKISVCLVSTGAGGTGITLTGADRVILSDPSWNPADDMQAVDRAYRIGQKRDVIVYRMIAAGTVEEKMYEKQIFKDGLRRTVMGGTVKRKKNVRYFSRSELKQLFTLYPAGACRVLDQLNQMHGPLSGRLEAAESRAQRDISLDGHLDFVCGLRGAYGASAHGDGLPKIVQQPAAEGDSGIGGGGEGGWHTRNQIDEEEDESDVEDSDGAGDGARGMRGGGMHGLLEEDLIALELDLDDGDDEDDDDDDGGATMAPRPAGRKGKGPSRLLRRHQPSGTESSSSSDDVVEGGSRPVLDLSVAGADRSTAIALSGDSDSECEFGGVSKGHDVVELMDDDDDDGGGGRADGEVSVGLPRTPVAINDSGGACSSGSVEASREGLGTPESWSVSTPPPGSPPPIGGGSAHNDSPMSTGGGGCESSGSNSRPLWEWNDQEEMGYEEEKETVGGIEEPGDSASASSPFTSGRSIVGDFSGGTSPAFSAKKEEEGEASAAVRAGRERARRWANDELGVSPVASSSPSGRGGGGGGGSTVGDTAEEGETLRRASDASKKVSAARKRAREFAVEELGAEMEGDGRHGLSSSYSSGDDDDTERCNPRDVQVEEEQQHGGYRSSDDSMDGGVEAVALYDGGGSDEGDGVDRSSTGGNAEDGCGAEEEETVRDGSFSSAIVMVDSSSSPARAAAPGEPTATADDSPGTTTTTSGRRWNDGNAAAPYCSSFPPLVGGEEGNEAVGDQSLPNDHLLLATPTPNNGDGDDGGPTPALDATGRGGYGGAWPQSVRSSVSSRSSYATAGSSHPQDVDGVAAVAAESRGDESLGGHERGDGDVGSSSRPKACFASPSSGGGGAERSPDGGAACDKGQRSGSKGLQEAPVEFSPVPPAPTSAPSSPAAAAADGAHFAPPAAAAAAAVCAAHKAVAESAGFTCRRCSCAAGAEAAEQAKGLLFEAWSNEREGDMYAAMGVCLEAIKLCDEDMELHKTISRIGSRMGCLS
ncbi:conserved unknown protein [Ectocarpus siliculosus]|uniref:Helicase C-terminal domain-containing protein n=1 Tax=Ectocarpus siliculosus TaxID=2880 RepID=D7FUZ5_ECTSI|nr:conserved unknown protein [Ectocarpus siliculosus]|eukprot:CBJ31801.1 conserved unknown protein [Ectocarpus siliculosus]